MFLRKGFCFILLLAFAANSLQPGYAQSVLPAPGGVFNPFSASHPAVLKGLKVYPKEPLRFDFILDPGTRSGAEADLVSARQESGKLIKYFLASLTIPEKDLWVNLSPYEKDRIIPEAFGQTEMGRDLLEQDYILKQITATLLYPQGETGKRFWQKVYALAQEKYGTTDIPVDTFNKVWIVPEKAEVYENVKAGAVYITDSRLKVMLDADYVASAREAGTVSGTDDSLVLLQPDGSSDNGAQEIARTVLREVVVPVLEQEVNEGANFAPLRQVYQSLILATWYKKKIRKSLLTAVYVDQNKIAGVKIEDPGEAEKIWQRYVESFRQGAFSLVREEENVYPDGAVPRKYFSGGVGMDMAVLLVNTLEPDASQLSWSNDYLMVSSQVNFSTDLSSGSLDNVSTSKYLLDGEDSAQANADTRVTFRQGVFGPWEMSRQVRAERILETIKTLDGLWGDVVSIGDLPKGASPAMPLDLSEVLSFYPGESFRLTNRHLVLYWADGKFNRGRRTIFWYLPATRQYAEIKLEKTDSRNLQLRALFSLLMGDEFEFNSTHIAESELLPDTYWNGWGSSLLAVRLLYAQEVYPYVVQAVVGLVDELSRIRPGQAIRIADIFGGDGGLVLEMDKAIRRHYAFLSRPVPEIEYWLVEKNGANISRLESMSARLESALHIVQADLMRDPLEELVRGMDIITSTGGGFNHQVATRSQAKELVGHLRNALKPGGYSVLGGLTHLLLQAADFEGLQSLNYSIPGKYFISRTSPQLYVLRKPDTNISGSALPAADHPTQGAPPWRSKTIRTSRGDELSLVLEPDERGLKFGVRFQGAPDEQLTLHWGINEWRKPPLVMLDDVYPSTVNGNGTIDTILAADGQGDYYAWFPLPAEGVSRVDLLVRSEDRWFKSEGWDQGGNIAFKVPAPEVLERLSAEERVRRIIDQDNSPGVIIDSAVAPVLIGATNILSDNAIERIDAVGGGSRSHSEFLAGKLVDDMERGHPLSQDILSRLGFAAEQDFQSWIGDSATGMISGQLLSFGVSAVRKEGKQSYFYIDPERDYGIKVPHHHPYSMLEMYGISWTKTWESFELAYSRLGGLVPPFLIIKRGFIQPNGQGIRDDMAATLRVREVSEADIRRLGNSFVDMFFELMEAVWQRGVFDRDFAIENVGFASDGHLVLIDFGFCQDTRKPGFFDHKPFEEGRLSREDELGWGLYEMHDTRDTLRSIDERVAAYFESEFSRRYDVSLASTDALFGRQQHDIVRLAPMVAIFRQVVKKHALVHEAGGQDRGIFVYPLISHDVKEMLKREISFRILSRPGMTKESESVSFLSDYPADKGGIDLNPQSLAFRISADGEIEFDIDPAMLESFRNAHGLSPVILSIREAVDFDQFFGRSSVASIPAVTTALR
jgi:hypothetical protein